MQFEHINIEGFLDKNRKYIYFVGTGICIHYVFGKYFGKRKGQFKDITKTSNVVENPTFMENAPAGFINGWQLHVACWLMATRFGQWYLRNIFLHNSMIELVRKSICDYKLRNNPNTMLNIPSYVTTVVSIIYLC